MSELLDLKFGKTTSGGKADRVHGSSQSRVDIYFKSPKIT